MTFLLEDALSKSAAGLSRRSEFMRYILESKIPGVHYHHIDDDVSPPKEAMTRHQILNAGRPRLVDGAHEDHIIPGYRLDLEGWSSNSVVLKLLRDQSSEGDPSMGEEECIGEPNVIIPVGGIFHSKSLEYLEKYGPFLMKNPKEIEKDCSMLLNIAENLEVLTPPDDPLPWDILNMSQWKASLCELIKEMKTVEENCSPTLIRNSGVYVLTTSPYGAFLRALAAEIADAPEKV